MTSKTLVDERVNKWVYRGVKCHNDDAYDVRDVTIALLWMIVVEHVEGQHRKPRDNVDNTDL